MRMNDSASHRILTAKSWMLFAFAFLVPLAPPYPIVALLWVSLWIVAFTWWTLRLGKELRARMPRPEILNEQTFQHTVSFAALYTVTILWVTDGGYQINASNAHEYGWKLWVIVPLHVFVMYCMFYGIYFQSKAIKTIRQANGHRDESTFVYMLGFWFFPIGIWIIQPRIIEILNSRTVHVPDTRSA